MDNAVRSLTTLPNGDLVAAGDFSTAGGVAASRIARWNGSSWAPLGTGISSASLYGLYAVTTMPNGDVVAGGYFTSAGGVPPTRSPAGTAAHGRRSAAACPAPCSR
jgi:hypothetical protein